MTILLGILAWCLLFALSPAVVGVPAIRHILMLAILVIVPMLLDLALPASGTRLFKITRRLLLPAGLLAGASFLLEPGLAAAAVATAWLLFAGLAALCAVSNIREAWPPGPSRLCKNLGLIYMAVGAGALVASRAGLQPFGFAEPIVLLTAVHFHFTGATMSVQAGKIAEHLPRHSPTIPRLLLAGVLLSMPMVATGILLSPWLQILGILVLVIFAMLLALQLLKLRNGLTTVAGCAIATGAILGAIYGWGEFTGAATIPIPTMVTTHGWIQALGFGLCGTLGVWFLSDEQRLTSPGRCS